jgi:hypothetical protein
MPPCIYGRLDDRAKIELLPNIGHTLLLKCPEAMAKIVLEFAAMCEAKPSVVKYFQKYRTNH